MVKDAPQPQDAGDADGERSCSGSFAVLRPVRDGWSDEDLVRGTRDGDDAARAAFFDAYADHVDRVITRILGIDTERSDLIHETFLRAFDGIAQLSKPGSLRPWLTSIAVHVSRERIRERQRGRWLLFFASEDMPEAPYRGPSPEAVEAVRATYAVLDRMAADDRIVFSLRVLDGMELAEIAAACRVSVATVKRRLARARKRFDAMARRHAVLRAWMEGGQE